MVVDEHIFPLFQKFKIVSVTSDQFFSLEQQKKFSRRGIHFREVSFNGANKNKLYDTTRDFFIGGRVDLCNDDVELVGELKNIHIDYNTNPPKLKKTPEDSEYPNDDLVDCLCGAAHAMVMGSEGVTTLPKSMLVHTGRL